MISVSKPIIEDEEKQAVQAVMDSGMVAQGPKVQELEKAFATYCQTEHAVALNSGTAALHAGLFAFGIKPGTEIITTPFTFVATANPILMVGAKIVFADVREEDFMLDPRAVEQKVSRATRAVIPVDLYGAIHDTSAIATIAKSHGLKILEDACQAIGAERKNKRAGSFGDAAAFSLYATKNIMSGEGGVLTTDDPEIAEQAKRFRHHGQSEQTRYEYHDLGYNYRMTDLCAAIAVEQLKKVEGFTRQRIENARQLSSGLAEIPGLITPKVLPNTRHVFHQYTIRITSEFGHTRDELMEFLKSREIGSGIYYPKPLHLHPHFMRLGYQAGDFPVAERLSKEVLSLPVHPRVTSDEIQTIVEAIKNYAR